MAGGFEKLAEYRNYNQFMIVTDRMNYLSPLNNNIGFAIACEEPRGTQKTWPALEVDGMYRAPSVAIAFGDVSMGGYMRQGDRPLVDTRGHVVDHVGLGVADLNAWFAKLRGESVKILEPPHKIGESRAFMIEGPSKEAIEIIEVK